MINFAADHIQDGWEEMEQILQFTHDTFPKRPKRRPLANDMLIPVVDHGW